MDQNMIFILFLIPSPIKKSWERSKIWPDWSIFLSTTALWTVKCSHKTFISHDTSIYVPTAATFLTTHRELITGATPFIDEIRITFCRNTVSACMRFSIICHFCFIVVKIIIGFNIRIAI